LPARIAYQKIVRRRETSEKKVGRIRHGSRETQTAGTSAQQNTMAKRTETRYESAPPIHGTQPHKSSGQVRARRRRLRLLTTGFSEYFSTL
jgi:hypothetical protein